MCTCKTQTSWRRIQWQLLQNLAKENNEVQQVVKVLKDFKTIKDMYFGKEVKSDYRVAIKEFEASYKLLGISVTP